VLYYQIPQKYFDSFASTLICTFRSCYLKRGYKGVLATNTYPREILGQDNKKLSIFRLNAPGVYEIDTACFPRDFFYAIYFKLINLTFLHQFLIKNLL
jgi:hypothetical protein